MRSRLAPLLLLALAACPRTPVPELRAEAETQIPAYVLEWADGAAPEALECPWMAGGFPESHACTSAVAGVPVVWHVTTTPVDRSPIDSVSVRPDGAVFTRVLEGRALSHALATRVTPPVEGVDLELACGDAPVWHADPGVPFECVVLEGDRRRVLRGTLTPDLEPAWSGLEDDTL